MNVKDTEIITMPVLRRQGKINCQHTIISTIRLGTM